MLTLKERIRRRANSRGQSLFATFALLALCLCAPAEAWAAAAQTVVVGTGDPNVDIPAVQAAVDAGGDVRLVGTFSFDRPPVNDRTVVISRAIAITGAADELGGRATILGGWRAFEISAPGAAVSVEGIHFFRPELFAIEVTGGARGLRIANCKFDGVQPRTRPAVGFIAGAISIFPQASRALVTGDVAILDNEIDMGGSPTERTYGILVLGVGTSSDPVEVQIAGNRVANVTGHGIDLRQLIGRATIERNEVRTGSVGGQQVSLSDSFVDGIRVLGTGAYLVRHNRVECGFENAACIRLQGTAAQPLTGATVEGNEIVMTFPDGATPGGQSAGVELRRAASGNAVLHNRITGRARAALSLVSDPTPTPGLFLTPTDNTFVGNNLSNFMSTAADVFVGPRVSSTTVVGGGGSVDDHGTDTVLKGGYRTLSGEHCQTQGGVGEVVAEAEAEGGSGG